MRGLALIFYLNTLITGLSAWAVSPMSIWKNNQVVENFDEKMLGEAEQKLIEALRTDPLNAVIHFNLGVIYASQKQFKKAVKSFRTADQLGAEQTQIRFMAKFNEGVALTVDKNIAGALSAYQQALAIDPQSQEVKTNIELLWQAAQNSPDSSESDQNSDSSDDQNEPSDSKKDEGQKSDESRDDSNSEEDESSENQDQNNKDQAQPDQKNNEEEQESESKEQKPNQAQSENQFDSETLSKEQVEKILGELEAQEQKIRAQEFEKKSKEAPYGKDW